MRYSIGIILGILLFVLSGCSSANETTSSSTNESVEQDVTPVDYSLMDIETEYQSLKEIEQDSALVAVVKLTGNVKPIAYQSANFTLTEAEIQKVLKGKHDLHSKINLLEVSVFNLNLTKKSDKLLLFLKKYVGPITEDAYTIAGVYQGKFNVISNKVVYDGDDYNGINTFQKAFDNKDLTEVEQSVQQEDQ
ncbi:hypothetical protein [Paenibacillus montanisoli]|uniref:Lipoprotein n=1 Tax=Paenibacillus montanisoli TaxID=2081970 RepID=A0A328UAZ7_9BACL|nr:hypothetical protein [Paenibacillus montanisoli]RAP78501.1 hypothetical protein DL346_08800 [Paenibacillus montanisoli]